MAIRSSSLRSICWAFLVLLILPELPTSTAADGPPSASGGSGDAEETVDVNGNDFSKLVAYGGAFVDKSMFIEEFLRNEDKTILLTRPRGWGKTTNINMLKRFLEIELSREGEMVSKNMSGNRKLFVGGQYQLRNSGHSTVLKPLKIAKSADSMKLQGEHPVLVLNMTDVGANTFQRTADKIKNKLCKLFRRHSYLKNDMRPYDRDEFNIYESGVMSNEQLELGIQYLSGLLRKHYNRTVYVFIDDYDAPINNLFYKLVEELMFEHPDLTIKDVFKKAASSKEIKATISTIHFTLCNSLKDNVDMEKGLITGTLHIYLHDWFLGGLYNVVEYGLMQPKFNEYFGFNEEESRQLFASRNIKMDWYKLVHWYGYNYTGEQLCRPHSVMHCLVNGGKLANYFSLSANVKRSAVDVILESDDLQEKMQNLADGKITSKEISRKAEYDLIEQQFYTVLLFNGYFNAMRDNLIVDNWILSIPNREVLDIIKQKIVKWVCKKSSVTVEELTVNARRIPDCNLKEFEESLREYMTCIPVTSSKKYKFYNAFVKSFVYVLEKDYEIIEKTSDLEAANAYLVLIPKENSKWSGLAIVMQYKSAVDWVDMQADADKLLAQVSARLNIAKIRQYRHVKQILKLTWVFWNQRFGMQHRLEKLL